MLEAFKTFIEDELDPVDEIPEGADIDNEFWVLFSGTGKFYGDLPYERLREWLDTTASGNVQEFEEYLAETGKNHFTFYKEGDEGI